jgi:hypothetical protein
VALQQDPVQAIAKRWKERELFFWTVRESAKAILLVALTVHTIVALIWGQPTLPQSLLESALRAP